MVVGYGTARYAPGQRLFHPTMHHHTSHAACSHDHASGGDARAVDRRRLAISLALVVVYMAAEAVAGWWTGSLALLADAGHMLSDAAALGLSLFAMWIAQRPPTPQHTYGYYRTEILAALVNAVTLIVISIFIFIEAARRFGQPPEVIAGPMMAVAIGGLCVNVAGLWILHAGKSTSLNVHGAWLHVLGDALGSVAAIAAGALIWAFDWHWADPVASVLIGLLVIYSSWKLLKMTVFILMQGTPRHLDLDEIRRAMLAVPGACEVHDLHVWTVTSGMETLSAHVVVDESRSNQQVLSQLRDALHEQFRIDHLTIQLEPRNFQERGTPF